MQELIKNTENDVFKVTMSMEEKLAELMQNEEVKLHSVQKWVDGTKSYLYDMKCTPNPNQLAVAIAATLKFRREKKQCWRVPPGLGKSRIIATLATILHKAYKKEGLKRIFIVFSS